MHAVSQSVGPSLDDVLLVLASHWAVAMAAG